MPFDILDYYGFVYTYTNKNGELVYEKTLSRGTLFIHSDQSFFDVRRLHYPRFCAGVEVPVYGIPIKQGYHEVLFPELVQREQSDLFQYGGVGTGPRRPANTIRNVYLCRAKADIVTAGAILLFYKGKSIHRLSQAMTTVGIFEDMRYATSLEELRQMAGGRSVYSERQLVEWAARPENPVKVINFLLAGHIEPPVELRQLQADGVFGRHPAQSIFRIRSSPVRTVFAPPLRFRAVIFVLAIVGLSGVGKSTLMAELERTHAMRHFTASDLIKSGSRSWPVGRMFGPVRYVALQTGRYEAG